MSPFNTSAPLLPEILSLHGKWKGNKTALISGKDMLSWKELDTATNQLANALNQKGIGRGDMVGIVMKNGRQMVEAIIGVMKSGACSVPVNLSVTDEAVTAMMTDAKVKAVITTTDQAERLTNYVNQHPGTLHIIAGDRSEGDTFETFKREAPDHKPTTDIQDDDPLNVIYSSGTTGMPKGILHTHRGRRDWAYDMSIALRYDGNARTLFNIGLYSNISWVGFLATLLAGGTLYVHETFDTRLTLETIQNEKITNFSMVPIQYQRLMEDPEQEKYDISSLKAVMSCGSPLHADLKANLYQRFGPVIIELFGLTEGIITTLEPEEAEGRMSSVGKPLLGTDIRIIGDDDKEVPTGSSGEIVANGRIVMPGYLNREDATREATWLDENGNAWIRTGDIGQLDEEGYLYIVDRKKDMILSGGQNIYPQDIEAMLITSPDVNDIAVIGAKSSRWGETPLAVVVKEPGAETDEHTLKNWANERLGKQQRIAGVVFTEALPRNPNGKILKRELRITFGGLEFD
ncbi:acyl--CoA ligase [Kordiimonas sp. SCSIO 12603]|uniref:class I adenylate-forming enzyme family protein n=1 Tax=Kordiimonas sp. SCSIO 12603 TaxID=2829596 RepID=UPI0021023248|nr:class I adenylate-forming enzyme family protein [Kordiimonas sp. SCSIO 12603]UTW57241.1 acyl--CoA ligase [Kordiimonas sp. SCSIO 12603]